MAALSLDFGIAGSIARGQRVSGDLEVVHYYDDGAGAVVGAIDGIGHGEGAAATARLAADVILYHPQDPPTQLLTRCHQALRGTRGVVLSLASIDLRRGTLTWVGVGNVSGVVTRGAVDMLGPHEELAPRPGLLGLGELPGLNPSVIPLRPRDTLIFATDGISWHFPDQLAVGASPQFMADDIIARYCPGTDDALVVVARAEGGKP
jgi:negative regulator of sigma-B (phosphoserine phosphatase)